MKVRKIYFDLDGVLADFDRGVHELCGMDAFSHEDDPSYNFDEEMWKKIKEVGHFYDKLELMEGSLQLFRDLYAISLRNNYWRYTTPRRFMLTAVYAF